MTLILFVYSVERNHQINGVKLHCQKALPKDQDGGQGGGRGGGMMGGRGGGGGGRGGCKLNKILEVLILKKIKFWIHLY